MLLALHALVPPLLTLLRLKARAPRRSLASLVADRQGAMRAVFDKAIETVLLSADVQHATVALMTTSVFRCDTFPDGFEYLRADPQIRCGTESHNRMQAVGVVYIIFLGRVEP